jgi:hypothetical protein
MSLESLKNALQDVSLLLRPGHARYPLLFEDDRTTPKKLMPTWLIDSVQLAIEDTAELQRLFQNNLHTVSSVGKISPWQVARGSIYRLFAGANPEQVVADLLNFVQIEVCKNWTYIGCYGGGVSSKFELSDDVAVMLAKEAPPSYARELIFGIDRWERLIFNDGLPSWRPNIALLISQQAEIFPRDDKHVFGTLQSTEEKAQRAIRALTLASNHPFVRSWQSSWLDHPAIPYEGFGGWGASGAVEQIPRSLPLPEPVDRDLARDMYAQLETLPLAVKASVELAIDRLARSRTHPPSADTALDLGIASEIILLNSTSGSELRYRYSLRGAHLLSLNKSDREAKYKAFREMYDARSKAVHEGTIAPKMYSRFPEFDSLCSAVIRKIVEDQGFPNWENLVLGISTPINSSAEGHG